MRSARTQTAVPACAGRNRYAGLERKAVSAADILERARAAGISVTIDGDNLVLEAPTPPSADVLAALRNHKADIIALLTPGAGDSRASASSTTEAKGKRTSVNGPTEFLKAVKQAGAELVICRRAARTAG